MQQSPKALCLRSLVCWYCTIHVYIRTIMCMLTYRKDLSLWIMIISGIKKVTCFTDSNNVHFFPQVMIAHTHYYRGWSFVSIYFYCSQRSLKDESIVCEMLWYILLFRYGIVIEFAFLCCSLHCYFSPHSQCSHLQILSPCWSLGWRKLCSVSRSVI